MTSLYSPNPANNNESSAEALGRGASWGRAFLRKTGYGASADASEWRKLEDCLRHSGFEEGCGPERQARDWLSAVWDWRSHPAFCTYALERVPYLNCIFLSWESTEQTSV